jgi:tRNA G46 methylase TrmB
MDIGDISPIFAFLMSSRSDHGVRLGSLAVPRPARTPRTATRLPENLPHYEFLREFRHDPDMPTLWCHEVLHDDDGVPRLAESSPPPFSPVDLTEVLDVPGPFEIEICTGKGRFLADYAQLHPDRGLLGVEWTRPIAWYAAEKLSRRLQGNHHARVVWGEALYLLRDRLPDRICSAFHIYFPDPWPVNRDRRVIKPELLEQFRRLALPGCLFHWATDHTDYHKSVVRLLETTPGFRLVDPEAPPTEGIRTSFESKYVKEGRAIHRCVWEVEPA